VENHLPPTCSTYLLKLSLNESVAALLILLTTLPTCWTTELDQSDGMLGKHLHRASTTCLQC
jgi:hypothetical protein